MEVCDGEKVYLLFDKKRYSIEKAVKEAETRFGGDLEISFADRRDNNAFTICKSNGELYCITRKEQKCEILLTDQ